MKLFARSTPLYRTALAVAVLAVSACSEIPTAPSGALSLGEALSPRFAKAKGDDVKSISAVQLESGVVRVTWSSFPETADYQIQIGSSAGNVVAAKVAGTPVVGQSGLLYADFANVPAGTYTVRFKAEGNDDDFSQFWTESAAFTVVGAAVTPPVAADVTPPVITPSVAGTAGNGGWYTGDVTVTWSVSDAESAISSQTGCSVTTVSEDVTNLLVTCTATSAGGTSSETVVVKRDATVPAIVYSGNAGSYTVDQVVGISCSASDVTSGLLSDTCAHATGDAYTFAVGANHLAAAAEDVAGNTNDAGTSFTVQVTVPSLCALVNRFVVHAGIANSLCVKLNAAAAAQDRGNLTAKANNLAAFAKEVQAQTGKNITAPNAAILLRLVQAL